MEGTKKPEPAARTELRVARRVAIRTGAALVPYVGKLLKAAEEAEKQTRAERVRIWSQWLIGSDDDPEVYADQVSAALEGHEDKVVREAVNESLRAAADAVEDIAIPSLALLTRLYLKARSASARFPDRRTYRELVSVFKALDADEFKALRTAVRTMAWLEEEPITTAIIQDPGEPLVQAIEDGLVAPDATSVWTWYTTGKPTHVLVRGDLAPRLVTALAPLQGGSLFASLAPPQVGPNKPRYTRALIRLLDETMPDIE